MVIIYYNIFLPLVLSLVSDNFVLLYPVSPLVTICLPYRIDYWLSNGCHVAHAPPLVTICLPYRIDYRLSNGCHVAHAHA